jgi:hypothetical protein
LVYKCKTITQQLVVQLRVKVLSQNFMSEDETLQLITGDDVVRQTNQKHKLELIPKILETII